MNKPLGYNIPIFSLAVPPLVLMVVSFDPLHQFYHNNPIKVPQIEVILLSTKGDLSLLNKNRNWTPLNAVFLPPFVVDAEVLYGQASEVEIFNDFRYNTAAFGGDCDEETDSNEILDCH